MNALIIFITSLMATFQVYKILTLDRFMKIEQQKSRDTSYATFMSVLEFLYIICIIIILDSNFYVYGISLIIVLILKSIIIHKREANYYFYMSEGLINLVILFSIIFNTKGV